MPEETAAVWSLSPEKKETRSSYQLRKKPITYSERSGCCVGALIYAQPKNLDLQVATTDPIRRKQRVKFYYFFFTKRFNLPNLFYNLFIFFLVGKNSACVLDSFPQRSVLLRTIETFYAVVTIRCNSVVPHVTALGTIVFYFTCFFFCAVVARTWDYLIRRDHVFGLQFDFHLPQLAGQVSCVQEEE